jgi:hypothetical protein
MPEESYPLVRLPGSERGPLATAAPAGQLDTSERDACSGLGSPDGTALLNRLQG